MDETINKIGYKFKTVNLFNLLLFLISPLFALPTIFLGVYKKNNFSLILLIIFASLITYQLVPSDTKDLYQFYRFYKDVKDLNFEGYLIEMEIRPDFMVYIGIYIFAKLGISGQFFFAICTFITLHLMYLVFNKFADRLNISNKHYLLGVISIFISIELLGLYSGIRNLLGVSIAIYGFYIGLFEGKKWKGLWFLLIASFTHFGVLLFFPIYFLSIFKNLKYKTALVAYLISFAFIFLTKKHLYGIITVFPLPETIQFKAKWYLLGVDIIEQGNQESISALISHIIRKSWIYFAHVYLLITYKRKSDYRLFVILLMTLLNIFSVAPDIHMRITYLVEIMFIYLLFYEFQYKYSKSVIVAFFIFLIPSFIVNIMVYRDYLMESLFNKNFLTLIGILLKKVELIFLW